MESEWKANEGFRATVWDLPVSEFWRRLCS